MLEELDRVTGYQIRPMALEEAQENFTPGADPNIDNLPKGVDDDDDCDFDGVVGGDSAQRVSVAEVARLAGRVSDNKTKGSHRRQRDG